MNPSHFYLYAWASVWEYPKHPRESTLGPIRNHHVEGGDQPSAEPAVRSTPCGPDWPYPLARWLVCGPLGVSLADVRNKVGLGTSWNQALSRSTFDFARLKTLLFCFFLIALHPYQLRWFQDFNLLLQVVMTPSRSSRLNVDRRLERHGYPMVPTG
jgi:hypothetical protein